MKKITKKKKAEAVKDYLSTGKSLAAVAALHQMSIETLRKAVGPSRMRKRGKKKAIASVVQTTLFNASKRTRNNVKLENSHKRWTKTELELLVDSVKDGLTAGETAKLLGRTNAAIMQRKHMLIEQGVIPDPLRFPVPEGIKRTRKGVVEAVAVFEEEKSTGSVPKLDNIDLVDLADLVKRFGLNVTITISGDVTTVNMHG